jgi:hypothetical protein
MKGEQFWGGMVEFGIRFRRVHFEREKYHVEEKR